MNLEQIVNGVFNSSPGIILRYLVNSVKVLLGCFGQL